MIPEGNPRMLLYQGSKTCGKLLVRPLRTELMWCGCGLRVSDSPLRRSEEENARPCGLMDKALVFGTKDCRFESCQGQLFQKILSLLGEGVRPSLRNSKSGARAPMKDTRAEHPRMTWNMCPCQQTGYSSVGRASDCRVLQQSDGPWFDSGWPDFHCTARASRSHSRRPARANFNQKPYPNNALAFLWCGEGCCNEVMAPFDLTLWPSG